MERLRSIELRMSEIRAKTSSLGGAPARAPFRDILESETLGRTAGNRALRSSSDYGALSPPVELTTWGNGRLPSALLEPIGQGEHRLAREAATAFKAMAADARRDGVILTVSDSYRSLDEQAALVDSHGHYGEGGLAAEPGKSAHGWGLAVDLDLNARATTWMRANAGKYGFAEDVPREPWHWTYRQNATSIRTSGSTKGLL